MTQAQPTAVYITPRRGGFRERFLRKGFFMKHSGYFEESLYSAYEVIECTAREFLRGNYDSKNPDMVVVNYRLSVGLEREERYHLFRRIVSRVTVPAALFVGTDRASTLPEERILDLFGLIFKREPYRDREEYHIKEKNRAKIRSTMLACPFRIQAKRWWATPLTPFLKPSIPPVDADGTGKIYDVFFSGSDTVSNRVRIKTWERLVNEDLTLSGGIQVYPGREERVPDHLRNPRLGRRRYFEAMRQAKINLAPDGIGQFTFRHLEIWSLGEFMISSPSIREIELLLPATENVHYVSYSDLDELVEKIRFYTTNDTEREKIARAGQEMFEKYYDPLAHGREIRKAVEGMERHF